MNLESPKKLKSQEAKKLCDAYTFIEMVVAVTIIIVLATVAIGYSNSIGRQMESVRAQAQLVSILNHAKSLAQNFLFTPPAGSRLCGYGAHVVRATSTVIVFQDLVPTSDSCSADANRAYDPGEELSGRLNSYQIDTRILEFIASTDSASPDLIDVMFIPPDPTVVINAPTTPPPSSGSIVVRIIGTSTTFDVRVNDFGQVNIE